jgi:starch synthase
VPRERLRDLGLAPGDGYVDAAADGIDLLRTAIERSELANTVSPGFAAEALTPEFGMGLDGVLRAKGDRFFGILNGLDTQVWNPATDRALPRRYSARDRRAKRECKRQLLVDVGLDPDDTGPVIGMIGRLDPQKGFDLLAEAAPRLRARGARLVVLGSGDPSLVARLRAEAQRYPDAIALIEAFDRDLARRIYAGVDLFAMPSRFEPSGQGQMIAMRYGTPPIVRRTGGLRDSVVDEIASPGKGTGFAFDDATAAALADACDVAIAMYERGGPRWTSLISRAMATDFDWTTGAAPRYVDAFRRAVRLREEVVRSG